MNALTWIRRMVPPWGPSSDPDSCGPALGACPTTGSPSSAEGEPELARALADFRSFPTIGTAADLLRFGPRLSGLDDRLKEPAAYLLEQGGLPQALRRLAQDVMAGTKSALWSVPANDPAEAIRQVRHSLRRFPRDPLTWLDLGRLHAAGGNRDSARRAVAVALAYGQDNRLILRGASRFFLHAKDPEKALATLHRSARTAADPWLMAGHIAISSIVGRPSRHIGRGRRIVKNRELPPWETAELAMALGMLELDSGATRIARKLFNIGLEAPNRNALAQGAWAARELKLPLDVPMEWLDDSCSAEAAYYGALGDADFEHALAHSVKWHQTEPFASRPMVAASFLADLLGQFDEAVEYARRGLVAEPDNIPLQNNLVFALALQGNAKEAELVLAKVAKREKSNLSPHTIANLGLLTFLSGDSTLGEELYEQAITRYRRAGSAQEAAVAGICRALAAELSGAEHTDRWKQEAAKMASATGSRLVEGIWESVIGDGQSRPGAPRNPTVLARRWHYDKQRNALVIEPRKPFGRT